MAGNRLVLSSRGVELTGWKAVSVSTSIEDACSEFELQTTDVNLPTRNPPHNPMQIRPFDECEITIAGHRILTGFVDRIRSRVSASELGFNLEGRSRVMDGVDSTYIGARRKWTEKTADKIAADLAADQRLEVAVEVDVGEPIRKFKVRRAEKVGEALERLGRLRALLVTDDTLGRVVLTRAGAQRIETQLAVGENVLSSEGDFDASGLYQLYFCRGQAATPTEDAAKLISHVSATFRDDSVERTRVLEVAPEGRANRKECEQRAEYEAKIRQGKSVGLNVRVQGWTVTPDGEPWLKNRIVQYVDPYQGVFADLLIVSVDYSLDESGGEIATMRIAPPEGYELQNPRRRKKRKQGAKTGVGPWKAIDKYLAARDNRPADRNWFQRLAGSFGIGGTRGIDE